MKRYKEQKGEADRFESLFQQRVHRTLLSFQYDGINVVLG